ncbi:MAG: hypothetical protein HPM95_00405 [Alphaproteobacteria bacterium]|nr:hypothetical protein [Alphaproteobacteria bacterium]
MLSAGRPVEIQPAGHHRPDEVAESYADLELDPDAAIPQFRPGSYGEAAFEGDPTISFARFWPASSAPITGAGIAQARARHPAAQLTATGWMSTTPSTSPAAHSARVLQRTPAGGYSWLHPRH